MAGVVAAGLVIDGGVEAQLTREPLALVVGAGHTYHPANLHFGDLAHHRSHCARRDGIVCAASSATQAQALKAR